MSKKSSKKKNSAAPVTKKVRTKQSTKQAWKMMDRASTIAAALVAQRITATSWRLATGKQPPTSAKHPEVTNREAIGWAIVAGAGVELVKVLVRRSTANYWIKSTGNLPPGMKPLKTPEATARREAALAANQKPAVPPVEETTGKRAKRRSRRS